MKAYLIISHGSHSEKTKQEIETLIESLKQKIIVQILEYAFLEIEQPDILKGVKRCVRQGATEVTILLNFLNSGRHVDADIPVIIEQAKQQYPNVSFTITKPIGQHPLISNLFVDVIKQS